MLTTNRIADIFSDAHTVYADALRLLKAGRHPRTPLWKGMAPHRRRLTAAASSNGAVRECRIKPMPPP